MCAYQGLEMFDFRKILRTYLMNCPNGQLSFNLKIFQVVFKLLFSFQLPIIRTETLCKKRPYLEFFGSIFSRIRTEDGEILSISRYLLWMRDNTDQKELRIWTLFTQWEIWKWSLKYDTSEAHLGPCQFYENS